MLAMMTTACSTDVDTPQISSPSDFTAPVIGSCNNVIVNADNYANENVIFTWSAADFGQPVQILYSLYVTDGQNSALIGTSNYTYLSVSKGDLNGTIISGLGYAANSVATVKAYVTAKMAGTDLYDEIASSNSNDFTVQTYAAPLKWLYLCGEFNSWTIGSANIVWEKEGGTNAYVIMMDMAQTSGSDAGRSYFKVTSEQSWSGNNWGYDYLTPSWTCPEQSDSNLSVDISSNSIYQFTINTSVMTIDAKSIGNKLGLIGSFNSWNGDEFFTYDNEEACWKTQPVALSAGDEVKVRVDSAWSLNWGSAGSTSTAIAGGIELKNDGDNISVSEAGSYVAVLYTNRYPFVMQLVKQ